MKQKGIYAVGEAILLGPVGLLAVTLLKDEYLFGWAAHNWRFYFILGTIALLLVFLKKTMVSISMTAGIILGIFIGNFLGNAIKMNNKNKIIEGMSMEERYRLSHHSGFEIWMGIILLSIVGGCVVQIILAKNRKRIPKGLNK